MVWCEAWPQERKDAEFRVYRARCRLRCLEANLDRIDFDQFDDLMAQLEAARAELQAAVNAKIMVATKMGCW